MFQLRGVFLLFILVAATSGSPAKLTEFVGVKAGSGISEIISIMGYFALRKIRNYESATDKIYETY